MILAKVVGNVVMSEKHQALQDHKLLLVQPLDAQSKPFGDEVMAIDTAQAGIGDTVLMLREGGGVKQVLKSEEALPIRSLIVGIVDQIDA